MQFLTAKTVLYIRVLFLVYVTYWLAKDHKEILSSGFVILFGQAMELSTDSDTSDLMVGPLTIFVASAALSDLVPLMANNLEYFETLVPIRLTGFFVLAAYSYMASSKFFSTGAVFSYAFFEIWMNFLIYNNLRDEKYYRMKHFVEEHKEEINAMQGRDVIPVEEE